MPYANKEDLKKHMKKYRAANKEKIAAQVKKYYKDYSSRNKKKMRERTRKYYTKGSNRLKRRNSLLKKKFGITLDDYNSMLKKQKNSCAICRAKRIEVKRDFAVDHNHSTGKVRGLLCTSCNMGLGMFKDSDELLYKVIDYLKGS